MRPCNLHYLPESLQPLQGPALEQEVEADRVTLEGPNDNLVEQCFDLVLMA